MKLPSLKKTSFIAIPVLCLLIGFMVFQHFSPSSSRITLKDQEKIDKILLHNPVGTHDCHCFPPKIATNPGFQITNITATSATFRWVCDVASSYQVTYGTAASKGTLFPTTRPTVYYTDYSVTVTGLKANTTYHAGPYAWEKSWGRPKTWLMENTSLNDWTFKTLPATSVLPENNIPPSSSTIAISEVNSGKITTREASINWKSDFPSSSQVEYGTTTSYGLKTGENTELVTAHYIQLFDLAPGTTYYYRVISKTKTGETTASSSFELTTQKFETKIANKENYFTEPNPCVNKTEFNYYLYQPIDNLTIDILTLSGKKVAVLEAPSSSLNTGWNRISWDIKDREGTQLINGLYIYIMKFKKGRSTEVFKRSQLMVRR